MSDDVEEELHEIELEDEAWEESPLPRPYQVAEALVADDGRRGRGIALGFVLALGISSYAGWPTAVSLRAIAAALALAGATGIGFGLYPAMQAAGSSPVEALRRE